MFDQHQWQLPFALIVAIALHKRICDGSVVVRMASAILLEATKSLFIPAWGVACSRSGKSVNFESHSRHGRAIAP
jgi:hypothetical protein